MDGVEPVGASSPDIPSGERPSFRMAVAPVVEGLHFIVPFA